MKKTKCMRLMAVLLLLTTAIHTMAEKENIYDLWPKGAPTESSDPQDKATLRVYLPNEKRATGRAVVICPGGGYERLAMEHEGTQWASFFNQQGIAAIVLKYRMPHGNWKIPVEDAAEAIRMVRRMSAMWHIDPNQVGIMGSSAGGHLAATIATQAEGNAAPNFQLLFYPVITMDPAFTHQGSMKNLLGGVANKKQIRNHSCDQRVTRVTPRAFIALSDDDHTVLPANGVNYYLACYRHDVPATLHIYPTGGHGWGFNQDFDYHIEMLLDLKAWLKSF